MSVRRTIVVLGDSIVYGWGVARAQSYPSLLQERLRRDAPPGMMVQVINAGVPGDTAVQGCLRYDEDVAAYQPDAVLCAFGLNDGALRRTAFDAQRERAWLAQRWPWLRALRWTERLRRLPREEDEVRHAERPRTPPPLFRAALGEMVRRTQRAGARAYLLTLTPVAAEVMGKAQRDSYAQYDWFIRAVAERAHCGLLDVSDAPGGGFLPATMWQEDGLHLSAAGQAWLAERVHGALTAEEWLW
jgi:lysophospholipase L1-like esterase